MADKIAKLLSKLPPKDLRAIQVALERLVSGDLEGLDIKVLRGQTDLYRVRVGNYRIIFRQHEGEVMVIAIARRNEKTYKGL